MALSEDPEHRSNANPTLGEGMVLHYISLLYKGLLATEAD